MLRPVGQVVVASAIAVSGLAATGASAQTASQITPPSYAPQPAPTPPPVILPESGSAMAPPGADALDIRLADVAIDGGDGDAAALAELKAQLLGHTIKVAEIFAAARALEARYAREGHVLMRVVVPAQRLEDGATLRLTIVSGFIERVDTSRVPSRVRSRVERLLAPLAGARDLTMRDIERRLLLTGDTPGIALRSTLSAGSVPGAAVLMVEATHRPVSGFVSLDNTLPNGLARYGYGLGSNFNSVLGLGETVYVRASGLPNTGRKKSFLHPNPRNRALAAGVILPLGDDGLSLNIEATDARTAPRHLAILPGFASRFQRLSGRLSYPFIRSRALTLSGELAFDAQNERLRIVEPLVLPLSLDELRIVRLSGTVSAALPGNAVMNAEIEGSVGIDALGARSAADATPRLPLSRQGADASFQKLIVSASLNQPLAPHLAFALNARAQSSFGQVMANAEQIGIASSDGLSPLPSGVVQGDAGYVMRAELRFPFAVELGSGRGQIAPYAFGAVGGVRFERPTFFERRETGADAYGLGLRINAATGAGSPGLSAGVEYGRAHVEGFARVADRLNFSLLVQF